MRILATAEGVTPLKPNTWYTLKWLLTEEGMQISVDGQSRVRGTESAYDLTAAAPITVIAVKSVVDLKEFRVTPLGKSR